MEFNKLIFEKLHPLFTEHGLKLTEESRHIVKYESDNLVVAMVHNPRENSNTLWIGRDGFQEVEVDNQILKEFFNSDLKLSNLSQETFVNNAFLFFIGDGEKLLQGNDRAITDLEKFNEERSSKYTENLIEQQYLEAANKAWKDRNYSDVIRYLEKVDKADLPTSFKQKYKIAQQRLSN